MKRLENIKYYRIVWLHKRIKELKSKIMEFKIRYGLVLVICLLLSSCSFPANIIMPNTTQNNLATCTNPNPIIKAFVLNGFNEVEVSAQLKNYGKQDIEGFFIYLKPYIPRDKSADWYVDKLFNKIRIDYNYFKGLPKGKSNEKKGK